MSLVGDFQYYGMSPWRMVYEVLFIHGSSAVFLFRLANFFYRKRLTILAKLVTNLNLFFNSCDINYRSEIGVGFKIYHTVGIVLGNVRAGKEFEIYQNVTVGANHRTNAEGDTNPQFGDRVSLYAGAVVAGPVKIGSQVKIGANTTVFTDIPDNSTVVAQAPTVRAYHRKKAKGE